MSRIPEHFVDELLDRLDVVSVIQQRVPLIKAGTEYKACCPFHDEKTPSFTVSPQKQFYHCFGCGAHGTALGFVMNYDGLEFVDAVHELAHSVGMQVPTEAGNAPQANPEREQDYQNLKLASQFFQHQLKQSSVAREYLQQRGLDQAIIERFEIGYAPDSWNALQTALNQRQVDDAALLRIGLLSDNNERRYDKFRHRIIFPIHDRRGRVIGFGGRALDDNGPKYLNSPETTVFHKGSELYGLFQARQRSKPEQIVVTEGYMDVIALHQHGVDTAVASLGTATTEQQVRLLFQSTNNVVCCYDGDRAGRDAAWKALNNMLPQLQAGRSVRFLFLPDGEDPDSMIRKHGQDGWQRAVERAKPLSDYFFDQLEDNLDLAHAEGRSALIAKAEPLLAKIPAGVYREQLLQTLSDKTRHQIKISSSSEPTANRTGKPRKVVERTPLRELTALILQFPELSVKIDADDRSLIQQQKNASLVLELIDFCREHPQIKTQMLLERWSARPESDFLFRLASWPFNQEETVSERLVGEIIHSMKVQDIALKINELTAIQQSTGLSDDQKRQLLDLVKIKQQLQSPSTSGAGIN